MKDVRYIQMTEAEEATWIRELVNLCIEMYMEQNSIHPPTPLPDENY